MHVKKMVTEALAPLLTILFPGLAAMYGIDNTKPRQL